MSDDALAALRNTIVMSFHDKWHHTKPSARKDIVRAVVEYVLATPGVVALPPDHPLRTGEPSEAMIEAALRQYYGSNFDPNLWAEDLASRMLRAALAVLRKGNGK